jgi:hypothetical protein
MLLQKTLAALMAYGQNVTGRWYRLQRRPLETATPASCAQRRQDHKDQAHETNDKLDMP